MPTYTLYTETRNIEYSGIDSMVKDLSQFKELMQHTLWFDFESLSTKEKLKLGKMFNLTPSHQMDLIEDNPHRFEERYEQTTHYLYISLYPVDEDANFIRLILANNVFISIREKHFPNFPSILKLMKESKITNFQTFSPDWMLHCFLDVLIDDYLKPCQYLLQDSEECDEMIFSCEKKRLGEVSLRIQNLRMVLIQRRIELVSLLKIVDFLSKDNLLISKSVHVYFKDIRDQISFSIDKISFAKDILIQSQSNYLSRFAIDVQESSRNTDRFMELINLLAIISIPFAIVCGMLGTNVRVPFNVTDSYHDLAPFYIVVGVLIFVAFFLVVISRVWIGYRVKKMQHQGK